MKYKNELLKKAMESGEKVNFNSGNFQTKETYNLFSQNNSAANSGALNISESFVALSSSEKKDY